MYMHPLWLALMLLITCVPKQTGWDAEGEIKGMGLLKARAWDMLTTQMTTHDTPFNTSTKTTPINVVEQLTVC